MTLSNFVIQFSEQFDDTESSEFKPETRFRDLEEWSSMITLGLIAMTDEEYGIRLTGNDIRNSETIEDLYNIIEAQLNNG